MDLAERAGVFARRADLNAFISISEETGAALWSR